ncbi:MAG: molecular chaperone HtpG [Lactobacillales bacterium]|jgi:molecular chaperone HtpG|nr:molecular chaperone HtpG [Lactobacillales bacterium]
MTKETLDFKSDVAKVLDIVIHSLYSNTEIFLRELISNASDACDKLRYALLIHPELSKDVSGEFKITLIPDKKAKTLTVSDNGIGMSKEDLINHLGTIAKSGSAEFLKALTGDKKKDMNLIGQFGVGFYSSFMVADKVTVITKKAGEETGYKWESAGAGSFTIEEDKTAGLGTQITLHLKKEAMEYTDPIRLRHLVRQYSDHVSLPILLKDGAKEETVNSASALWTRSKAEITTEQYKDFYQSVSHAFDAPWMTLHYKAEGAIDYTGLLFIPTKPPFNLFQPDRKTNLQLYVNRVFISDNVEGLMPHFLRFVTGVIDTNDLPLNVSREMLQKTPVMEKIKTGLIRRILTELKKRSENKEDYKTFWDSFGIVFKEGLYEPIDARADVAELCRFHSLNKNELISFEEYVAEMKAGQKNIYYLTGSDLETLKNNPQLEGYAARGIDVLLLNDPIDEFWVQTYQEYKGKKIVSVLHGGEDISKIKPETTDKAESLPQALLDETTAKIKDVLAGQIGDVKATDRLTKSPMALITPEGHMSLNLERLMKAHGQQTAFNSARILEINPKHPLIHKLAGLIHDKKEADKVADCIWVLYDQTLIVEGEAIKDPAAFMRRMTSFLMMGL